MLNRGPLTGALLLFALAPAFRAHGGIRAEYGPSTVQARTGETPQLGPQPPCGNEPIPPYPGLHEPAVVKSWSTSEFRRDWKPPGCTGWAETGYTRLVTISARFTYLAGMAGLLRQVGAISGLKGMRYWSTTHKQWRTLILDAYAVTDPNSEEQRKDFMPDEVKKGKVLYFAEINNLSGKAIYQMKIIDASPIRLVFSVENVSTMRYHLLPIFHPGDLQSVYFLDRESDSVWRYYSIVRIGQTANGLMAGNDSSFINRAVAFYRNLVGIPTTQEPPVAP